MENGFIPGDVVLSYLPLHFSEQVRECLQERERDPLERGVGSSYFMTVLLLLFILLQPSRVHDFSHSLPSLPFLSVSLSPSLLAPIVLANILILFCRWYCNSRVPNRD